jgi:very-short-patch-repair endonuclease
VSSAKKWLKNRWPPQWLAFYQTKVFGPEKYSINYYARVLDIQQVYRWQLFPNQPGDKKSSRQYYKLKLEPLRRLSKPILSRRWRRIVFIPTTWLKFVNAVEINDLYDDSPLEDRLWAEFKRLEIQAERQVFVKVKNQDYALDFAVYCAKGDLDIETDGDTYHNDSEKASQDNVRDNTLKTVGWRVLRFNTPQIQEKMTDYCIPTIVENINNLGGIEESKFMPRKIDLDAPGGTYQPSLFDDL